MPRPSDPLRRLPLAKPDGLKLEERLDLHTVGDLLWTLPLRYVERGRMSDLSELVAGESATIVAEVEKSELIGYGKSARVQAVVGDGRSKLNLTFFRAPWRHKELQPGVRAMFAGSVGSFRRALQMVNPEVQLLDPGAEGAEDYAGALIPIYPTTDGVKHWVIPRAVRFALDTLDFTPDDEPLPPQLLARHGLVGLEQAWALAHRPSQRSDRDAAVARLIWDEAFIVQIALARRRATAARLPAVPRVERPDGLLAAFDSQLPYELTAGQREIGREIATDQAQSHPMHRLLQGEVGSGKTVVALRAMLTVVDSGAQAVLLAPTEVLAAQHLRSVRDLLGPLATAGELGAPEVATQVTLLTGSLGARRRREALALAGDGRAGIVIGTHALLSEGVEFRDLGLVVVDEQHRFGVEQRDRLRSASDRATPHLLVMTATPIPRTVAMTVFGDLEVSTLTELPRGRQPISTHVVPEGRPGYVDRMWQRVREAVEQGRQAFVVCPRISVSEDDDGSGGAALEEVLPMLEQGSLQGLRLAALHGRLSADDKDAVMGAFVAGQLDVLVATTVIEVGVDVPNTTIMVVLDADRFGVSQLHQLRGRIGRGQHASTCFLHTRMPAAASPYARLEAVAATTDGMQLALVDLEQRREGDVLGVAQSGRRRTLRHLDLIKHVDVVQEARAEAVGLVETDPTLAAHPALKAALERMLAEDDAVFLEKG